MAGNSSLYEWRKQINNANIDQWKSWSVDINYVVEQFNNVIQTVTDRLGTIENSIESLMIRCNEMEKYIEAIPPYVKLQHKEIDINSCKVAAYAKTCGVFSHTTNENKIYVYVNKTVKNLFVDGVQVESNTNDNNAYLPFMDFSGSVNGTIHTIKTDNADKFNDIKLAFSFNDTLTSFTPNDSSTAILDVKITYHSVVIPKIQTIDKSSLSTAIINQQPVIENTQVIDKQAMSINQYSTVKTVASISKNRNRTRQASQTNTRSSITNTSGKTRG